MLTKFKNKLKKEGEVYLLCKIFTGADESKIKEVKRSNIQGKNVDVVILKVKSLPAKSKANKEILKLIADEFDISVFNVSIVAGSSDRSKLIKIKK